MFADDTTLSTHNKCLDVVITSLTNDLSHVDRLCEHNHMYIHSDKSIVMFISSRQIRQILQYNPEIKFYDSVTKSCSTAKLLGVTVNNSLSCSDHIGTVIKNAIHISIFYHESNYISQLTVVNAFITHILFLMLIVIWGKLHTLPGGKLLKLQKRAARVILDCDLFHPIIYNDF